MVARGVVVAILFACCAWAAADEPKKLDGKKAEELRKALVGKWESQDADKVVVEFTADGKIKEPFIKRNGKWVIVEGTYTIDDTGLVKYSATTGDVKFGGWYRYKHGELVSPRGPNPQVVWKKVEEKK